MYFQYYIRQIIEKNQKMTASTQTITKTATNTRQEKVPAVSRQKLETESQNESYEWELVWRNIILYTIMHLTGLWGFYLVFTKAKILTTLWAWLMLWIGLQGITSGVHRLWTHKAYKAKLPLKIILCIFNTIALQKHIYGWCQDHRVHHKYVDTDADPHNSKRGLFFSHVGWLFIKGHPEFEDKSKAIDMSDMEADPVVMLQKKYYFVFFAPVIGFFLPAWIPYYYWNEDPYTSFFVATMLRYCLCTNITFLVNSFAHIYGTRPYDKNLRPTENVTVTLLTGGEGWHNYHHVFPWDYKAGEFGTYSTNTSTALIDFFAKIGWAYDLKSVSEDMLRKRVLRTGDGTRKFSDGKIEVETDDHSHEEENFWGWGDKDMTQEHINYVKIEHRKDE